jgi:hydrogenase-4 component B
VTTGSLLAGAGICAALGVLIGARARRFWIVTCLLAAGLALASAVSVLGAGAELDWWPDVQLCGQPIHLRLDGLGAFFMALLATLCATGTLYSHEYWPEEQHPESARAGRLWWSGLFLCMGLVLVCSNGLHFLIAWELFTVCAYFLITLRRDHSEVREAGWLYLAASHAGTLCLFAFFASLSARTGSWDLGPMQQRADLGSLFWLALVGFGVKAGLFPLHIWLPSAHANAPSHVSAVLSGVAIKIGIFGIVRFSGWLPAPESAGWVVAGIGATSAVLGVAFALGQHDFKRLLAYHSVENIGIILMGLGFAMIAKAHGHPVWGILALTGGLLHVWNHGLFKALLFLAGGSVLHATGSREMSKLGGLWRAIPWTAGLFGLGAAAIAGLPPLNGFVSEWLIYLGLFDAAATRGTGSLAAIVSAVLLGMTGALALACFVKVCGVVFLGAPRTQIVSRAHEFGWFMRGPMLTLALACVVIGLAPALIWPAVTAAASAWHPGLQIIDVPAPLAALGTFNLVLTAAGLLLCVLLWSRVKKNGLSRALTWDCGYAAPTARMQYTAGSFAATITSWFGWILRPRGHVERPTGVYPHAASFEEHTPETVLEDVVEPVAHQVMRAASAARRLQHGRLQAYFLYMLAGLVLLTALAVICSR